MAMGIVSDSNFDLELEKLGIKKPDSPIPDCPIVPNSNEIGIVEDVKRGRGEGRNNIPDIIRETVARASINGDGTASEIARAFEVSESSVSAYKVGATSTSSYHEPDESLLSTVIGHRQNISKAARERLLSALDEITPDRLAAVSKVRDLAAIAKDMSAIITDMEPPLPNIQNNQQNVQFVFMAPRVRSEETYTVREVND